MANPFLFMEEEVSNATNAVNDTFQNPFLIEDDDDEAGDFPTENTFSASNPFAFNDTNDSGITADAAPDPSGANFFLTEDDDEEDEQMQVQQHEIDPTMSFFGTTINENDVDHDDEIMKAVPPTRPTPSTQQMISNLTDHLDQTSENLLGKIPVTRTPSPVSMRDLHSPSPTPDVGDLLDVSEAFAAATEAEQIQEQQTNYAFYQEEQKPNRPPPPRPIPPRPTPPKTASTPIQSTTTITQTQAQPHEDDLFDVHGVGHKKPPPKPPAPKTKEDILNLYQAPCQPVSEKKADLLSDDIDFTMQQPQPASNVAVVQPYVNEQTAIPQEIIEPVMQQETPMVIENHVSPMTQGIPTITEDLAEDRHQSYFMDPEDEIEQDQEPVQQKSEISSDQSPTESGITSGGIPASNSGSMINMALQEMEVEPPQTSQEEANPFTDKTPTPQKEQLTFLTSKSENYVAPRPTTPDPIVAQPELAPIFNIGGAPELAQTKPNKPPPPPVRGGSVLTTVSPQYTQPQTAFPQQSTYTASPVVPEIQKSDEFDDFAAKFENTGATKSTGNAFLDSLGTTDNSTDAWGDSNAFGEIVAVADDGFGGDDGFDTWEPPAVPESTPYPQRKLSSGSNEAINVTIRPKGDYDYSNVTAPALAAPPARSPYSGSVYSEPSGKINFNFYLKITAYFFQIHHHELIHSIKDLMTKQLQVCIEIYFS